MSGRIVNHGSLATLAAFVLLGAAQATDHLAGWSASWHAWQGSRALARANREPLRPKLLQEALVELADAVVAAPVYRRYRLELEQALDVALARLGAKWVAARAPGAIAPRAVFAARLRAHGDRRLADDLLATLPPPRRRELEGLSDETLAAIAQRLRGDRGCAAAAPVLELVLDRLPTLVTDIDAGAAACLIADGEPQAALRILRPLHERSPDALWPRFYLGNAYLAAGRPGDAQPLADGLVSDRPDFYYGWHLRARVLAAAGHPAEAADAFERALSLRPANRWLRDWIAGLRRQAAQTPRPGGE